VENLIRFSWLRRRGTFWTVVALFFTASCFWITPTEAASKSSRSTQVGAPSLQFNKITRKARKKVRVKKAARDDAGYKLIYQVKDWLLGKERKEFIPTASPAVSVQLPLASELSLFKESIAQLGCAAETTTFRMYLMQCTTLEAMRFMEPTGTIVLADLSATAASIFR
jgi:hypothetical protein